MVGNQNEWIANRDNGLNHGSEANGVRIKIQKTERMNMKKETVNEERNKNIRQTDENKRNGDYNGQD